MSKYDNSRKNREGCVFMNYSTVITPVRTKAITGFTRGRGKLGRAKLGSVTQEQKLANMPQIPKQLLIAAISRQNLKSTVYSKQAENGIMAPVPADYCGVGTQDGFCY